MMLHFTILCFSFFISAIYSVPLTQRDVFSPSITSPNTTTVWTVGQIQTVTWDTTNIPPDSQLTTTSGKILLGFLTNDSANLQTNSPLAQGFYIRDGMVNFTVPSVDPRDDYIVALLGDSGNFSPKFVIQAGSSANTSSTITGPIPITGTAITGNPETSTSPIPITGTVITGNPETTTLSPGNTSTTSSSTSLTSNTSTPISQSTSSAPSSAGSSTIFSTAPTPSSGNTNSPNAAWSHRIMNPAPIFLASMASLALVFVV